MSDSTKRASKAGGDEEHDELMVSYLDGELSAEEAAGVERRLGADESFRSEMRRVEAAWEALDHLPVATVDDDFSKTTLALVAADVRGGLEARTRALPVARSRRMRFSWFGAAAATVLGFLCLRLMSSGPDRWLVQDLPSVQYIDVYTQFQDAELLRGLETTLGNRVWAPGVSQEELDAELREFAIVSASDTRKDYLEGLSESDRSTLRMRFNRFQAMPIEEQERLRALHADVAEMTPKEQAMMLQYRHWIAGLEDYERFELRQLNDSGSTKSVVDRVRRSIRSTEFVLDERELEAFGELVERTKRELRAESKNRQRKQPGVGTREFMRGLADSPARRMEFFAKAKMVLSEKKRERFEQLPLPQQAATIRGWAMQLWEQRMSDPEGVSATDLEEFFVNELPVERKAELLSQPGPAMERRLRQMYVLGDEPRRGPPGIDSERGPRRGPPGSRGDRDRRGFGPPGRPEGPGPHPPGPNGRFREGGFPPPRPTR